MVQQSHAITIFCCYAHEDTRLLLELKKHLSPLQRQSLINVWYDGEIRAGTEWAQEIKEHLSDAKIILLLISPNFTSSDYCYSKEMKVSLERHKQGDAKVIPVIVRPITGWENVSHEDIKLGDLQALPIDAKAVTTWQNRDLAWGDVVRGIERVIKELTPPPAELLPAVPPPEKMDSPPSQPMSPVSPTSPPGSTAPRATEPIHRIDTHKILDHAQQGNIPQKTIPLNKPERPSINQELPSPVAPSEHMDVQTTSSSNESGNPPYAPPPVYTPQIVNVLPTQAPAEGELRCPNCNTPYEAGDTFCSGCGRSLAPAKQYCSNCNYEIKDNTVFCPNCGASVYQSVPDPQKSGNSLHLDGEAPADEAPALSPYGGYSPDSYGGYAPPQQGTPGGQPPYGQPIGYQQPGGYQQGGYGYGQQPPYGGYYPLGLPPPPYRRSMSSWWLLGMRGLLAVLFGLIVLVFPGIHLLAFTLVFGAYAIINGIVTVIIASRELEWGWRVEGILSVLAGTIALVSLVYLDITALVLSYLMVAWAILTGIMEIVMAFAIDDFSLSSFTWAGSWSLALAGVLSIVLGIVLFIRPYANFSSTLWSIGIYGFIFGVSYIVYAFQNSHSVI